MLPDDHFINGDLKYLAVGNECRLMDVRRTPGIIKSIDMDGGFFRWEISDFEDKGSYWDVPFEGVERYQFKKTPQALIHKQVSTLKQRIQELDSKIEIHVDTKKLEVSENRINAEKEKASIWLKENSSFLKSDSKIDFQSNTGTKLLRDDFNCYMVSNELFETEKRTAETQVLNPQSGDWVRGIQIVLAEMGLRQYIGPSTRSSKAFDGIGSKENRVTYIIHRLAFLRAIFDLLEMKTVTLYRGMVSETGFKSSKQRPSQFWSSWTFNYSVARDFSELRPDTDFKDSYLIKRDIPVEKLFMTFLETDAMNSQYLEAEAIVLLSDEEKLF